MITFLNRILVCFLTLVFLGASFAGAVRSEGSTAASGGNVFLPVIMTPPPLEWIGPGGGLIAAVAISPLDPNIVYAGSWGGGAYKSTDGGATWTWKSQGLDNWTVVSMAVDPGNPNVAYAGTYRGKVFKTVDGGETWFLSSQGVQDQAIVYSTVIEPGNSQRVYIATRGISGANGQPWRGIVYRSDDGGGTWQRKLYNLGGSGYQDYVYSLAIHPRAPNLLFAATHEHGIYRSSDYGDSWQGFNDGITNLSTRAVVAGNTPDTVNTVYTGIWEKKGVYKSTNLGTSWAQASSGLDGAHIYSMDIDPGRPRWVYAATYNLGLMRTTNAAGSWSNIALPNDLIATVRVSPAVNSTIFAGTAGNGLYASRDSGSSWQRSQTGLNASSATALVVSPDDPQVYFASTYGSGVMRSPDGGATWEDFSRNLGSLMVNILVVQPGRRALFALTDGAGLYRCDLANTASCWQRVGTNLPSASVGAALPPAAGRFSSWDTFWEAYGVPAESRNQPRILSGKQGLQTLAFSPSNPELAYIGTDSSGVYKSTNGGLNWTTAGLSGKKVYALAVDPANPLVVYASTSTSGEVRMTADGGSTWGDISLPGVTAYSLAVPATAPGNLYAGTSDGVYLRSSGAWNALGPAGSTIPWVAVDAADALRVIAGSTNGAFISLDGGASWKGGPGVLEGYIVQYVGIDPTDPGWIHFCTTLRGCLRTYIR